MTDPTCLCYLLVSLCLQYVKDVDEDLARAAIRAVGQIVLKASGRRSGRCMGSWLGGCLQGFFFRCLLSAGPGGTARPCWPAERSQCMFCCRCRT